MKKKGILYVLLALAIFSIFYFSKKRDEREQSKSEYAAYEQHLKYKELFEKSNYHFKRAIEAINDVEKGVENPSLADAQAQLQILQERSSYHLEQIVQLMENMENDLGKESLDQLESAIVKIQTVNLEIQDDSINPEDVYDAFNYSLNAIARADLTLSEQQDSHDFSRLALKQAQLHIKTVMLLEDKMGTEKISRNDKEQKVLLEVDDLLGRKDLHSIEYVKKIEEIISDIDLLLNE
jgi:hypothetical protein